MEDRPRPGGPDSCQMKLEERGYAPPPQAWMKRVFAGAWKALVDPAVGSLFACPDEDGIFTVMKVLAVDDVGVHVRFYSNRYAVLPTEPPSDLGLLGMGSGLYERIQRGERPDAPGRIGIGHLPLSRRGFRSIPRTLIRVVPVASDELDGYRCWRAAGGGIWPG